MPSSQMVASPPGSTLASQCQLAPVVVTTFAGNGSAALINGAISASAFNLPHGVAFDPASGRVWVTEGGNNRVRLIDPASGMVSTVASGLFWSAAGCPGVTVDANGNGVVANPGYNQIKKITVNAGARAWLIDTWLVSFAL